MWSSAPYSGPECLFSASLLTRNVVKRRFLFWSLGSLFSASLLTRSVVKRSEFWTGGSVFSLAADAQCGETP